MTYIVIVSSIITIIRLLTFEQKTHNKKVYMGLFAYCICVVMLLFLMYSENATFLHALIAFVLACGALYHKGNVSQLVKGLKKWITHSVS